MKQELWKQPVFFARNRVFRVYQGGLLFHDFLGDAEEDGYFPEEWIASDVHAINPGHDDPFEGISRTEEGNFPFSQLLQEDPEHYLGERKDIGILVKFLDSAIRLPMQVHPTREFARENFGSPYGKAEAWLILETRENACIYFGFDRSVSREEFAAAVRQSAQDKNCMTSFVNRVPVKTGDVFFVPAGVIHAIGAGCMLLEIQEPTDFTIQPEEWCGDYHLSEQEMYLGLSPEKALDCFNFSLYGESVLAANKKEPIMDYEKPGVKRETLIGAKDTPCFRMERYVLTNGCVPLERPASIYIVTRGSGTIVGDHYQRDIQRGNYFFLPAAAQGFTVKGDLELVCCIGCQ